MALPQDPNQPPKPPGVPGAPPVAQPPNVAQMRQKFFDARRGDLNRQATGQHQEAQDAVARRMTAIGQAGSGAAIDAGIKARTAVEQQAGEQINQLAGQEAGMAQQEAMQGAQMAQQESQFGRTMAEQGRMFDVEQGNKLQQLDMAQRQMNLDKEAQWFNQQMAELQSGNRIELDISRGQFKSPDAYNAYLRRLQEMDLTRQHRINNGVPWQRDAEW